MRTIERPGPPVTEDPWAWERHYTHLVEHLMVRDGERALRPSQVRVAARSEVVQDWRRAMGSDPPDFVARIGQPREQQEGAS